MLILALIVGTLALARLTRLVVEDRLTLSFRRWVVRKTGEDSLASYFVHCPWCMSIWLSPVVYVPAFIWPNRWVIMGLAMLAGSYVTGLLSRLES